MSAPSTGSNFVAGSRGLGVGAARIRSTCVSAFVAVRHPWASKSVEAIESVRLACGRPACTPTDVQLLGGADGSAPACSRRGIRAWHTKTITNVEPIKFSNSTTRTTSIASVFESAHDVEGGAAAPGDGGGDDDSPWAIRRLVSKSTSFMRAPAILRIDQGHCPFAFTCLCRSVLQCSRTSLTTSCGKSGLVQSSFTASEWARIATKIACFS